VTSLPPRRSGGGGPGDGRLRSFSQFYADNDHNNDQSAGRTERTCAVAYRPACRWRPQAVVVVTEVLVSWNDSEVKPAVTRRSALNTGVEMTTHQFAVAWNHLISTRVLCATSTTNHISLLPSRSRLCVLHRSLSVCPSQDY